MKYLLLGLAVVVLARCGPSAEEIARTAEAEAIAARAAAAQIEADSLRLARFEALLRPPVVSFEALMDCRAAQARIRPGSRRTTMAGRCNGLADDLRVMLKVVSRPSARDFNEQTRQLYGAWNDSLVATQLYMYQHLESDFDTPAEVAQRRAARPRLRQEE